MGQGSTARKPVGQQVVFSRTRLLGTSGNGTFSLGFFPAGANILRIGSAVRVVFSGGTPAGTLGTRASPANMVAALATQLTTIGRNVSTLIASAALCLDVDTELVAVVSGTPTAGTADIEIEYTLPDETP
jgi:hypothetical protein